MSSYTKAQDLVSRNDDELNTFVKEKQEELFKLRMQLFTGQLENNARIGHVRREIARAKTIQTAKVRSQKS